MRSLSFNSVENEFCENIGGPDDLVKWRVDIKVSYTRKNNNHSQIHTLINQMREYGVGEENLFDINDLMERTNIPKVARCLKQIAVIVSLIFRKCKTNFEFTNIFNTKICLFYNFYS